MVILREYIGVIPNEYGKCGSRELNPKFLVLYIGIISDDPQI